MPKSRKKAEEKIQAGHVKLGFIIGDQMKAEDFIVKISELVDGPVNMMRECQGDLYCSDQRKLSEAAELLHIAAVEIQAR